MIKQKQLWKKKPFRKIKYYIHKAQTGYQKNIKRIKKTLKKVKLQKQKFRSLYIARKVEQKSQRDGKQKRKY